MQTGTATMENSMESCWDYTLKSWNTNSKEPMHLYVIYSIIYNNTISIIYNSQVLEAT